MNILNETMTPISFLIITDLKAIHGMFLKLKKDNCFLIGDSAGLASVDLGEGISPSIESGLLAAVDILPPLNV